MGFKSMLPLHIRHQPFNPQNNCCKKLYHINTTPLLASSFSSWSPVSNAILITDSDLNHTFQFNLVQHFWFNLTHNLQLNSTHFPILIQVKMHVFDSQLLIWLIFPDSIWLIISDFIWSQHFQFSLTQYFDLIRLPLHAFKSPFLIQLIYYD